MIVKEGTSKSTIKRHVFDKKYSDPKVFAEWLNKQSKSRYRFNDYTHDRDRQLYRYLVSKTPGDFYPFEYHEDIAEQFKSLNLKVGDKVLVVRAPNPREKRLWDNTWIDKMNAFINHIYEVQRLYPPANNSIELEDRIMGSFYFPPWILRKVKG